MPPPLYLIYYCKAGIKGLLPSTPPLKTKMTMSEFLDGLASGGVSGLVKLATGSIGSLLGTAINGSWRTQARFQRDMQKQLMSHQAELNRQQYDYEMSQESPSAQRQRLEAAGLNPALMMSGAGGSSGISASVGSVSGGSAGMPHTPGLGLPNISLTELSQIEANKAIARDKNADAADKEYYLQRLKEQDKGGLAGYELSTAQFESETAKLTRDLVEQDIISRRLENRIKEVNARIATATADTQIALSEWELEKLMSEVASIEWQNLYHKARGESAKELVATELTLQFKQIALLEAQSGLIGAQSDYVRSQKLTEDRKRSILGIQQSMLKNEALVKALASYALVGGESLSHLNPTAQEYVQTMRNQIEAAFKASGNDRTDLIVAINGLADIMGRCLGSAKGAYGIGELLFAE